MIIEWDDGRLCVVQARTGKRFAVAAKVIALLDALTRPSSAAALAASLDLPVGKLGGLLASMADAGVVTHCAPQGAQPDTPGLTPYEMLVHARAAGKGTAPTRPHGQPPSPRHQHPGAAPVVALPRLPERNSLPLTSVLARRRSLRTYAARPMQLTDLSSFLADACAVRDLIGSPATAATHRSSPSAGARHSLEVYVLANRVSGLPAAAYHYDPFEHHLVKVAPWHAELEQIQERLVCTPARLRTAPQATLYLTSVVRRVAWKYPSGVLSLIYRDAGCLLQTMYLVATDLGLAPCAVAGIDADLSPPFLRPYQDEMIHVGSFGLGVRDAESRLPCGQDGTAR